MAGVLYIVPTPIGNLEDITERARRVLGSVGTIAAEDTRRCRKLLQLLDIPVPQLIALHEHNEAAAVKGVQQLLAGGQDVALVSDAGTPLVSDPGHLLLRGLWAASPSDSSGLAAPSADVQGDVGDVGDVVEGVKIVPLPGPSAVTTLLSACPLPLNQFTFAGFLPAKPEQRKQRLSLILQAQAATVVFESPHRIAATLGQIAELAPQRRVFVGRELTKLHESLRLGTASELLAQLQVRSEFRGEFALVIEGCGAATTDSMEEVQRLLAIVGEEMPPAQAARLVAKITGRPKSEIYTAGISSRSD